MSRHDVFRLVTALVHGVGTVVSVVLIVLVLRAQPAKPEPEKPRPRRVPEAQPWGEEGVALASRRVDRAPPPLATSDAENAAAVSDPAESFRGAYRVVLACLDLDPPKRSCIVVPTLGGEQRLLAPGDRLSGYLLLEIDPVLDQPRSVRLKFREERRAADFEVVLQAAP